MNTLHINQLNKQYKSRQVVKNVSLHLKCGEIVGLLGPNGAGKTTSFYMIVGLISCDGGQILFNDKNITHLPVHARAQLGISYLPQEASIFRKLTVADNIMAILELRKDLNKKLRIKLLNQLLEELRITHIRDSMGMSLSGGERRRVEIARALAIEPKFILLDEPFAGIDHNVRETLDICERAYIVNQGEIICEGTPQMVLQNKQVKAVYLGENFNL
jgi:lipopolysaccharide export system ATP-binding protein